MAVSAVIQSAARLERGRTLNNVVIIHGSGWTQLDQILARGREGGRGGRGGRGLEGEGRGGEGRGGEGGQGREGRGGRGGEGRGGEGRGGGGECPHFPQTRTFVTAEPSRPPAKRVTG